MLSTPSCMVGSKKSRPSDSDNQVANCTIRMETRGRSEFVFSPALFSDFHLEAKSRQNPFSLPKRELAASGQGVSFSRNLQKSCFLFGPPTRGANKKKPRVPSFLARSLPAHFRTRKCFRLSCRPHFRAFHCCRPLL